MGYEVTVSYYVVGDNGEPNREDTKTKTLKVGDSLEEVSPERVAATIMKQFSKRDIWIEKVDVYEFVKKPVTFKEAKNGGVILGGKRYNLGLNEIMKWAVDDEPRPAPVNVPQPVQQPVQTFQQPQPMPQQPQMQNGRKVWPHEQMRRQNMGQPMARRSYATNGDEAYPGQELEQPSAYNQKASNAGLVYAHRDEICDPPPELRRDLPMLYLTPGRKYRILEEQLAPNNRDYLYKIINDQGREAYVGWHYFRQQQLVREETPFIDNRGVMQTNVRYVDQAAYAPTQHQPRLLYEDQGYNNIPRGPQGDIGQMISKMDAAITRRRGL